MFLWVCFFSFLLLVYIQMLPSVSQSTELYVLLFMSDLVSNSPMFAICSLSISQQ